MNSTMTSFSEQLFSLSNFIDFHYKALGGLAIAAGSMVTLALYIQNLRLDLLNVKKKRIEDKELSDKNLAAALKTEREFREKDIRNERELREKDLLKERELREKERELREKEKEYYEKQIAVEQKLREGQIAAAVAVSNKEVTDKMIAYGFIKRIVEDVSS
jgi:hypothetical protein